MRFNLCFILNLIILNIYFVKHKFIYKILTSISLTERRFCGNGLCRSLWIQALL